MTGRTKLIWTGILSVALSCAAIAAHASGPWDRVPAKDHLRANPLADQPEAAAAGEKLYRDHCAQCHKADARGDGHKKPSLRSAEVQTATDGDLEWFMRQGDLGRGMPTWSSLPQAQRWQIVAYLRSLK